MLPHCDQALRGRRGAVSRTRPSALFRGPLPFQTLLRSPFVSAFGVSGSFDSISRPEVQKPQSTLKRTAGPQGRPSAWDTLHGLAPQPSGLHLEGHGRPSGLAGPPPRKGLAGWGARGSAARGGRDLRGAAPPVSSRVPSPRRCAPEPPNGGRGSAEGMRRGTHRPGRGAQGPRRAHSPLRPLAARARTPPRPGARSAAAAGGKGTVKFIPGAAQPPAPPPRRAHPVPRPPWVRVGAGRRSPRPGRAASGERSGPRNT